MEQSKRRERTVKKILATSYTLLSEKGYANVSMRDIADNAGVALSMLTYHFKTKESLLTAVIENEFGRYLYEIESELDSSDSEGDVDDKASLIDAILRKHPGFLRLTTDFVAQALWIPSFKKQINTLFDKLTAITKNALSPVTPKHSAQNIEAAAAFILNAIFGTSVRMLLGMDDRAAIDSLRFGLGMMGAN